MVSKRMGLTILPGIDSVSSTIIPAVFSSGLLWVSVFTSINKDNNCTYFVESLHIK